MADPVLPPIIKRKAAIAAGLVRYFTGKPCSHGHIAERYTANGLCASCRHRKYLEKKDAIDRRSNAYNKRRRAEEPETIRAQGRALYKANAAKISVQNSVRYALNIDKMRARSAAYYKANAEQRRADAKAWRVANPEKARHQSRMNKARRRGAPGRHTRKDVAEIYALQKGKCACCRVKVGDTFHVDHIQPVAKGGSNARSNLQILCRKCNQRKRDKDPLDFSRELGLLL